MSIKGAGGADADARIASVACDDRSDGGVVLGSVVTDATGVTSRSRRQVAGDRKGTIQF